MKVENKGRGEGNERRGEGNERRGEGNGRIFGKVTKGFKR